MEIPSPIVESVGSAAGILTTICWLPQAVHVFRTRDTKAISLTTYSGFAAGVALWLAYGILLGRWPIIAANLVTLPLVLAILAMKLRHG
jgi:MtN3 and saliva related transmembrane protein